MGRSVETALFGVYVRRNLHLFQVVLIIFLPATLEVLYLFHKKNAREEVIKELQFKNMKLENERQAERKGRIKAQKVFLVVTVAFLTVSQRLNYFLH